MVAEMKQRAVHCADQPVVGGIYRDRTGSSLVVVDVVGNKVLLEYASGAITAVDIDNWQLLYPQSAAY